MSNTAILERVAAGELSPEEGADLMRRVDSEERARRKPAWAPAWLWGLGVAVMRGVLKLIH
jgi:hypothetical protein